MILFLTEIHQITIILMVILGLLIILRVIDIIKLTQIKADLYDKKYQYKNNQIIKAYHADDLDMSVKGTSVYKPSEPLSKTIRYFALKKNTSKRTMIIQYKQRKEAVNLLVYVFNRKLKLIHVLLINDHKDKYHSDLIILPSKAEHINIMPQMHQGTYTRVSRVKDTSGSILLDAIIFFLSFFVISYFIGLYMHEKHFSQFLSSNQYFLSIIFGFMMTVIYFKVRTNHMSFKSFDEEVINYEET